MQRFLQFAIRNSQFPLIYTPDPEFPIYHCEMSTKPQTSFAFEDPDDYGRLRDVFARADYSTSGVLKAIGKKVGTGQGDRQLMIRQCANRSPISTLIRLFVASAPVDAQDFREAIAPMNLESWLKAGMVGHKENQVLPLIKMIPLDPFVIAHDIFDSPNLSSDFVMGVGASTETLVKFMINRRSRLALDMGSGSGILGLFKSLSADRVILSDRNSRAIRFADFNIRINNLPNVECREGDLFEPVKNLKFDYIVSNAPFVITPSSGYLFLDGGSQGDQFIQRFIRGAAELLNEGGYCQFLCNWAHFKNQNWVERLGGWFQGIGCDAWALHGETLDPSAYTSTWIGHFESKESPNYGRLYNEWMDYYTREQIEAMSMGYITMRKSSGKQNWFHVDEDPFRKSGDLGESIIRFFGARDFLRTVENNDAFLRVVLKPDPELRLDVECQQSDGIWSPVSRVLRLDTGLGFDAKSDGLGCDFIARCDGTLSVGQVLQELAARSPIPQEQVVQAGLYVVRHFVERGFLRPVELPEKVSSGSVSQP